MAISEDELARGERFAQAATSGVWRTHDGASPITEGYVPLLECDLLECEAFGDDDTGTMVRVRPRFRRSDDVRFIVWARRHVQALIAELRHCRALLDPTPEQVERLAEAVHAAWMQEKQRQGRADHPYHRVPARIGNPGETAVLAMPCCSRPPEQHHPDMVPFDQLPDATKEYDRATVRAVLAAVRAALGEAAPHATPA